MKQYVDEDYYLSTFEGTKLEDVDELDKILMLAQEKIDSITFNRIVRIGIDNLTEFQRDKVKKAICYQAEYIYENGFNNEENKQEISSYSVLDINVSVKDKDTNEKTLAEKVNMSEIAYDLIHKTGLDCRSYRF